MASLALGTAIAASSKLQHVRPLFQALWNHDGLLNAARFFLSFIILLVPTTAMGLTIGPRILAHGFY